MARQIPWPRVVVEGVVIVGSILLAFAIDAWWDGRQERREEREALEGLERDFAENVGEARAVVFGLNVYDRRLGALEAMSDAELAAVRADSALLYAQAISGYPTFDPRDGTLDAMLASGRLVVIRDRALRSMLVEWKAWVGDVEEQASVALLARTRVMERAGQLGGPWEFRPDPDRNPFPPIDLTVAARDPELMGLLRLKRNAGLDYYSELDGLTEHAGRVLTAIKATLRRGRTIVSISVAEEHGIYVGDGGALVAQAILSDGSTSDVSYSAQWTSSDSSVISITESGLGEAVGPGESEICATLEGVTGCGSFNVAG